MVALVTPFGPRRRRSVTPSAMRVSAMGFATGFTTCALEVVNVVLVTLSALFRGARLLVRALPFVNDKDLPRPSVVIVGASFAGLWAQRALSEEFDVTLIDLKNYFEYTPGVLRLFVEPEHVHRIARPLPSRRHKNVLAQVTEIAPSHVSVRSSCPQAPMVISVMSVIQLLNV